MGAVKAMAIELEIRQDEAIALGDPGTAYRLGMLEACSLITKASEQYLGQTTGDPYMAINTAWRAVFEAASYLRNVTAPEIR